MKYNNDITAEYVRECLDYDPETGLATWKRRPVEHFSSNRICNLWNSKHSNKEAGTLKKTNYRQVTINHKRYTVHRLAWLIVYGEWPKNDIDHIDKDRRNNKITNLRDVTNSENQKNRSMNRNNTSGHTGIKLVPNGNWVVVICVNGKNKTIGTFRDKEDAIQARKDAEIQYGFHPNHGKTLEKSYGK